MINPHLKSCLAVLFGIFLMATCSVLYGQGCPSIELKTPDKLQNAGESFSVKARLNGSIGNQDLRYDWTISTGVIESGQGSNEIVVATTKDQSGQSITVKVVVSGRPSVCVNAAEGTVSLVNRIGCGAPMDEFGAIDAARVKERVDNAFISLASNPGSSIIFEMTFSQDENLSERILRIQRILDAIKFLKLDINQAYFVISNEEGWTSTSIRIAPSGYNIFEMADRGEVILGRDIKERLSTLFKNK